MPKYYQFFAYNKTHFVFYLSPKKNMRKNNTFLFFIVKINPAEKITQTNNNKQNKNKEK